MNKKITTAIGAFFLLCFLFTPCHALTKGVVLNFSDVDISTMVKFISELTGRNFIMDDRVKGRISVYSPSKISPEEAFNVFTSVLELKGFTVVQAGRVNKIVPTSAAKQSGMKILTGGEKGPVNDAYVARVIPLENIAAQDAVTFLQPVVSKDGYIASTSSANILLVVDSDLNVQKILGILKIVDTSQKREGAELVFLKYATSDNVANVIREWMGIKDKGSRTAGQSVSVASGGLIVPDSRLNALIIFGSDRDKEDIKRLISMVDVPSPTSSSKINVYYLENADATEAAKVLEGVVKESTAAPAQTGAQVGAVAQQSAFEGSKILITPDKATNSLVILASPADYQNLLQVIRKLDKRRRQVFVEAVIAEVSLDKLKDLGTQLAVSSGWSGNTSGAAVFDPFNFLSAATPQQAAIVNVLKTLGGNTQIGANFNALLTSNAVNVLSTPTIMTSDNKEAEIFVGQNVPLVTQSNLTSTGLAQQSIERKDVGIDLKITPQITEGDYLKLDIYQEISRVTANKGQATDLVTDKRSAKTSVVVRDKDTVVIGGLIQDEDTEIVNKIPILGDIPLIGWLFKTKSTERNKTNLMILLTPRIIKSADDMAQVTDKHKNKFETAVKSEKPFNLDKELKPTK